MDEIGKLQSKQKRIMKEIASLGAMRKGSLTQQYYAATQADGSKVSRGPYPIYTFKQKGKTISRRLKSEEVENYRRQIETFRRFQELSAQLVEVSQQLADAICQGEDDEKKTAKSD